MTCIIRCPACNARRHVESCENIVSWSQTSNIIHRLFVICPLLTKKKKKKKSIIPVHYNNDNNDNNNNNNNSNNNNNNGNVQ